MDIVPALLAAYVLAGSIWPQLVRRRDLFLLGAATVAGALLLGSFHFVILQFLSRLADTAAFVLLVLAAGASGIEPFLHRLRR